MKKTHVPGGGILRERHEHLRERVALQPLPPHVGDHAHHCVPRAVGIPRAQREPSAHGSCPGHERRAIASLMIATRGVSGRSPIEKKRPRSNGVPRVLKKSALTSSLVNRRRSETVPSSRSTVRSLFPGVLAEQIVDDAGALHTRDRLNLFEHAVVQVGPLRGDAEGRRRGDLHHKDPLRPESRINVVHVPTSFGRADRRRRAERSQARTPPPRGRGGFDGWMFRPRHFCRTLLAGRTQVAAQRGNRWRQSHQDSRQNERWPGPSRGREDRGSLHSDAASCRGRRHG